MKIFFDFDDVLYSPRKWFDNLVIEFEKIGISREIIEKTYRLTKEITRYNHISHIEVLLKETSVSKEKIEAVFQKLFDNTKECVYPDTIPLLEKLKGNELVLITFGNRDFQSAKVKHSGLGKFFKEVVILDSKKKYKYLEEVLDRNEKFIFLDDRPDTLSDTKMILPNATTIRINREDNKISHKPSNGNVDFTFSSLKEAEETISSLCTS